MNEIEHLEQVLLGKLINNANHYYENHTLLNESLFSKYEHKELYKIIDAQYQKNNKVDLTEFYLSFGDKSSAINLAQQLRAEGRDVSAKDVLAYRNELKEMPLMDAANQFGREQVFGTQGTFFGQPLAGGGIAKLAGVDQGPPPESGPNSQGLQGLMKRVRNL